MRGDPFGLAYDRWLEAPYADEVEPPQCDDCGEWMEGEEDADEDGRYWSWWCPRRGCGEDEE